MDNSKLQIFTDPRLGVLSEPAAKRLLGNQLKANTALTSQDAEASTREHLERVASNAKSWNLIYWIEVPLRNVIHAELVREFGERWWHSRKFQLKAGSILAGEAAKSERANSHVRLFLDDLSLWFWIRLLSPSLEQRLWVGVLRSSFTDGVSRKQLHNDLLRFKTHRNSIAHHELRSAQQQSEMRQLAIRIARCIDNELVALIDEL